MDTRIIIRASQNEPPEDVIAEAIAPLIAEGFEVTSASTAIAPHGTWDGTSMISSTVIVEGSAKHVYYVTTVVLRKD